MRSLPVVLWAGDDTVSLTARAALPSMWLVSEADS